MLELKKLKLDESILEHDRLSNDAQTSLPIEPIIPAQISLARTVVGRSEHAVEGTWTVSG